MSIILIFLLITLLTETMANLIIHKYKPFRKWKSFISFAFFTFIKWDIMDMLDRAAKRVDFLLYTKPMKDVLQKRSQQGNGNKITWKKI